MVAFVQQMLDLQTQVAAAKTAHEKTVIQRQIDGADLEDFGQSNAEWERCILGDGFDDRKVGQH